MVKELAPRKSVARVQFWGTRGSLPKPGHNTLRYGGNTSCVQVTSPEGSLLVIDCGTGAHELGQALLANAQGPLRGSILISHTHWDHIQGFPFFAPLFVRGGEWDIYGPAGLGQSLRDTLAGQMQYNYFPLTFDDIGATIRFHDLVEGTFRIDDILVTTRYLNHPALTLGFRLEMGSACVVYACDHEPYSRESGQRALSKADRLHCQFLAEATLVIHDGQFTDAEYGARKGWGHSPVEYAVEMSLFGGVQQLALSHHDPLRSDDAIDQMVKRLRAEPRNSSLNIFAAADGQIVTLESGAKTESAPRETDSFVLADDAPAIRDAAVIMGISDAKLTSVLSEAARIEGVRARHAPDGNSALKMAKSGPPALILLEDDLAGIDGLSACRMLRSEQSFKDVPIVIVADHESDKGTTAGVTGWLLTPFSSQYARTHIQAWIMRAACRWQAPPMPPNEETRLAALRDLAVLDTASEERFDRITRLASALADVPIAVVSLVDAHRQWFKSCHGMSATETSREQSFCGHVVFNRQPMIVPDTLRDDRFADNPLVTGAPRIRFYAGFPLFHDDGSCVGTLCLIDTRPRQFGDGTLQLFGDLARLVQQELNAGKGSVERKDAEAPGRKEKSVSLDA